MKVTATILIETVHIHKKDYGMYLYSEHILIIV